MMTTRTILTSAKFFSENLLSELKLANLSRIFHLLNARLVLSLKMSFFFA